MRRSELGKKYSGQSGIRQLMDDLGSALAAPGKNYILGGGNPALISEVTEVWRRRMHSILGDTDSFDRMLGIYDTPQGRPRFIRAVASMLNDEYGWPLSERNIAVTNGSQSAFHMIFKLFGGRHSDGVRRKILFPLLPEYIGYADQSVHKEDFVARRPLIEHIDEHTHKYHIDFERLGVDDEIAAICVSRPTNPSGNVLTNAEITRLAALAESWNIPLLVDNAYGSPFPDIIFVDAHPIWNEHIVLAFSLSKIGLPSLRTGIVIANEEIINALSAMNAIFSLSTGTVGQAITEELIETKEILEMSRLIVRPFYERKAEHALRCVRSAFGNRFPYSLHRVEGSLFLWLWFPDLPDTTVELYERLTARNVVIVPGVYFFYGNDDAWEHRDRCIRLNYAMDDNEVADGIKIIAEEVERMYDEKNE